jgi:uncharacterized cupredoxin-like copper-binding protein
MKEHMRWIWLSIFLVFTVLLTACGGTTSPSATGPAPTTVNVTLTDFNIISNVTQFSVGVPYHFAVVNTGATEHELMIAPPMTTGMTMEDIDRLQLFEVSDIAAGQTKTTDYTFKESATSGQWEFACHIGGHYEKGMKLPVTIVK